MESSEHLVSVIIPTVHRPDLLRRAVHSALAQTLQAAEIIVVVDGPDPRTIEALKDIEDVRLRVRALPHNVGPAEARNIGVQTARGRWVALLDHDDVWMPNKLQLQLEAARQSSHRSPVVGCRFLVRFGNTDLVWPTRLPKPDEPISEYLFCRTQLFAGEGMLPSSTIFTTRELLLAVPFKKESRTHDDVEWILHVARRPDVGVELVREPAPLAIWHRDDCRPTLSSKTDWRFSLSWVNEHRDLFTARAYASCLMTWISAHAVQEQCRRGSFVLLRDAYRYGTPSIMDLILFLGIWGMPSTLREHLARRFSSVVQYNLPGVPGKLFWGL